MKRLSAVAFLLSVLMLSALVLSYSVAAASDDSPEFVIPLLVSKALRGITGSSTAGRSITGRGITGYATSESCDADCRSEGYEKGTCRFFPYGCTGREDKIGRGEPYCINMNYICCCRSATTTTTSSPPEDADCSSLGESNCLANLNCCWGFGPDPPATARCYGTGESCCHDAACDAGDDYCQLCPNDALDCYVCRGGTNNWENVCSGQYTECKNLKVGDACDGGVCSQGCNCVASPSPGCIEKISPCSGCAEGFTVSCSLSGDVCQQGDRISGLLKSVGNVPCSSTPTVQVEISGSGCSMSGSTTAGSWYCSGGGCYYDFSWSLPEISIGCIGKSVDITVSAGGASASESVTLSDESTTDNPPTMPSRGTWSPDIVFHRQDVTFTVKAKDDKGLKKITVIIDGRTVETCSDVSGTSGQCSHTASYEAGRQLSFEGNALDTRDQEPLPGNAGKRPVCIEICEFPSETDNGKEYDNKGTCKYFTKGDSGCSHGYSCEETSKEDFCPWDGATGYCCRSLEASSGYYWDVESTSEDGTAVCCRRSGKWGACLERRTIDCKNILGEYYKQGGKCEIEFYDCSGNGKVCQNGACVEGGDECQTHEDCKPDCQGKKIQSYQCVDDICVLGDLQCDKDCGASCEGGDCASGYVCDTAVSCECEEIGECTDSDNGKDYYVKGTATKGSESSTDTCTQCTGIAPDPVVCGAVTEYYCSEAGEIESETFECPDVYTCVNGACVESTPTPENNFKIELYGDYNGDTSEYSTISIDDESIGKACYQTTCTQCGSWDEGLTAAVDTSGYCSDGTMEVSFADSSSVDHECNAKHRACIYANDQWNCCDSECDYYRCSDSVSFDCNDWSCVSGTPPPTTPPTPENNFKIELYGDYNGKTSEYSKISIDDESIGNACYQKTCTQCSSWDEGLTATIDTSVYCADGAMEVSFEDSSNVDHSCDAKHRACIYANEEWNCCEEECGSRGCSNSVIFNCNGWGCGVTACQIDEDCRPACQGNKISPYSCVDGTCVIGETLQCDKTCGAVCETDEDCSSGYRCNNTLITGSCECEEIGECTDSDGGENYYVKGTVTDAQGNTHEDVCILHTEQSSQAVTEWYCDENGDAKSTTYTCPSGCEDGACISTGEPEITSFDCSAIGSLKAQCTVGVQGLDADKKYYAYVAGSGKENDGPAVGATVFSGSEASTTVVVLTLKTDTYELGAWLFEGTDPDVLQSALAFWTGEPVEVEIS